jgi:hypothetical protein
MLCRRPAATVNYRPVLSSERALQNSEKQLSKRKSQGERKIGCWSQMDPWHQDGLADWLSVVMWLWLWLDCLCGLVVWVPSIPRVTRFSEKWWIGNGVHSASWVQLRSYLEENIVVPVFKTEIMGVGEPPCWIHNTLYPLKLALTSHTSVWSLGRYSSLADSGHGGFPLPCKIIQDYNFTCTFVWVWNLVSDIEGGTQTEGVWEQDAEEYIRTKRDKVTRG